MSAPISPQPWVYDPEKYGLWCQHGHRLMVPDPAGTPPYPGTVMADPWPCNVCTADGLAAEMDAEADAHETERWDEYYEVIREGLAFGDAS